MQVIEYTTALDSQVVNIDALPRGLGLTYLECVRGHNGMLIAKQWRRVPPTSFEILIHIPRKVA